MRITKIKIRNLFGIREFEADGKDAELSGKNGVGKTAVLDAIRYALTNRSDRKYIISNGEKEGEVLVETDTGLRVNRKIRTEKADYKSIKQSGDAGEKTESFLRDVFTELQLNPIEFSRMTEKEQNRIILDLIDFKWDMEWIREQFGEIPPNVNYDQNILCVLHDIQAEEGHYFQKRQDINREMRNKMAFIGEIGASLPPGYDATKWEAVNLGDAYKALEKARSHNRTVEKAREAIANRENKIRAFQAEFEIEKATIEKVAAQKRGSWEKQIIQLKAQIDAMQKDLDALEEKKLAKIALEKKNFEAKVALYDGEVKQYEQVAGSETVDTAPLQSEADTAEKMKAFLNEHARMTALQGDVEALKKEAEALNAKIEKARTLPQEILEKVELPIAGLEVRNGVPLINGLPVSNLSEGQRLELCVGIATKREGSLNMVLIDGVEKLATDKRDEVYKALKDRGVQFLATRTTDEDSLNITEL